jgi:hypothetical protein
MSKRIFLWSALLIALSAPALADGTPCAQSHKIVGQCFVVHGRMFFPNGTPGVRIWRIGSKRILGVLDGAGNAESDNVLPAKLTAKFAWAWDMYTVYGDFEVCPLAHERPGWMQFVCLKSAQHVTVVTLPQPRAVR